MINLKTGKVFGHTHTGCGFRWYVGVIRNGKAIRLTKWRNNLLLDGFIDSGTGNWAEVPLGQSWLGYAAVVDPVRRDTNTTTLTVTGTTCVSSGNFFTSADVGRLIKFNDVGGSERYITAYTNATTVTLASTVVAAALTATVWYVNQTALNSVSGTQYITSTSTYTGTGSVNGTAAVVGQTLRMTRTLQFAALATTRTFTEVGFGGSVSALYDRDVINPPITLVNLDIPYVVCEILLTFTNLNYSVPNFGGAYNTAGQYNVEGAVVNVASAQTSAIQYILPTGVGTDGTAALGDFDRNTTWLGYMNATYTQNTFSLLSANPLVLGGTNIRAAATAASYTTRSFYRDYSRDLFNNNATPLNLYGFTMGTEYGCFNSLKFTTNFTVAANYICNITWRKSWQRILIN